MTKISARIIADSKNEFGNRITTMEVIFPRFILAELNTHRMMSRNSASSRAIPFEKMLKMVKETPFIPIAWQKDHKGMQGTEYITDELDIQLNKDAWLKARDNAVSSAEYLNHGVKDGRDNGVTKQLCNRLLEPFMYHKVLITATEWENFFALRCPRYEWNDEVYRSRKEFMFAYLSDTGNGAPNSVITDYLGLAQFNKGQAEIHMMELAECMWDAMNESTPKELKAGEWHIPFEVDARKEDNIKQFSDLVRNGVVKDGWEAQIKIATARCARVSYTVVGEEDKPANYENDIKLHDRLRESGHMSPFEHCAQAMNQEQYDNHRTGNTTESFKGETRGWSGNFRGFIQYRNNIYL